MIFGYVLNEISYCNGSNDEISIINDIFIYYNTSYHVYFLRLMMKITEKIYLMQELNPQLEYEVIKRKKS